MFYINKGNAVVPISSALREEAKAAFFAWEEAVVRLVLRHPGWRLDDQRLQVALATGDEDVVRQFIESMQAEREELMSKGVGSREWEIGPRTGESHSPTGPVFLG